MARKTPGAAPEGRPSAALERESAAEKWAHIEMITAAVIETEEKLLDRGESCWTQLLSSILRGKPSRGRLSALPAPADDHGVMRT